MVSHDVLRDCAHHALTEWQHAEYKGNWHPLPAAEDVWEGRWLTGFHFQVACPGGGVSNCHPFFVKVNASLPKGMFVDNKAPECSWSTSKRYAVEVAKELRRRGTPVSRQFVHRQGTGGIAQVGLWRVCPFLDGTREAIPVGDYSARQFLIATIRMVDFLSGPYV